MHISAFVWMTGACFAASFIFVSAYGGEVQVGGRSSQSGANIDKLQYRLHANMNFKDVNGQIVVAAGAELEFKAVPEAGKQFSAGVPLWGVDKKLAGTGETIKLSFNQPSRTPNDVRKVLAVCGNTKSAEVVVVDLSLFRIVSRRIQPPVEGFLPVNAGEWYDDLGFEFKLDLTANGMTWPEPEEMKWEFLGSMGGVFSPIKKGDNNTSIIHFGLVGSFTFWHKTKIRFFCDIDGNNDSTLGDSDPFVDSPEFKAGLNKQRELSYCSVRAGAFPAAMLAGRNLAVKRDFEEDRRACITISTPITATVWPVGAPMIIDTKEDWEDLLAHTKSADVWVPYRILCDIDGTKPAKFHAIVVNRPLLGGKTIYINSQSRSLRDGRVVIHEHGHFLGRSGHNTISDYYVMWHQYSQLMQMLTLEEANIFHGQ